MNIIKHYSKLWVVTAGLVCWACAGTMAQVKAGRPIRNQPVAVKSRQLASFMKEAADAGIDFKMPAAYKELPAVNNENFSFDYAITNPGRDFEIWFQVHSLKQNWASYEQVKNITGKALANPDSTYADVARATATALSDDDKYFARPLSAGVLAQYQADAGKTFLLNLVNLPETHRYKYALLIALQKDHIGYVMAVCLTNEKGPAFFKNINQARNCLKFR